MMSMIGCSAWKPATMTMTMTMTTTKQVVNKGGVIECSSRPKKKATSHHIKSRPKKTQPWDIRRKGPTLYPPLPLLPPDWTLVSSHDADADADADAVPQTTTPAEFSPSS
ncbi:Ribosomal protein L6 chloroplast protein [Dioscorea alata]|uniref:Ribosomal protein L6 chloroplast protein n=1 Tax=Dioscorea alata TaxID=55571 RepID=A0ACB7WNS6_DIOAL|nr:Ribosomal protein L6 chloroplast protein [Dioscorea alata]